LHLFLLGSTLSKGNYLSASDIYNVHIECVFSYNLDLLISNRNRLTVEQFVKLHSAFELG